MIDLYEKSRELIKEATSNKKEDINKAITLIEMAIEMCPERVHSDYYKLSSYYHISGDKLKAYEILLNELTYNLREDYSLRSAYSSQVYEKICSLCFTDKNYDEYIYYYSLNRYNINLAIYTQGRVADYERCQTEFDEFGTSYSSKIKISFNKIGKFESLDKFSKAFSDFFISNKPDLLTIINLTSKPNPQLSDELFRLLNKFTDEYFIEYYNINLKPLIT